ncbi:hypothetical protein A2U94_09730 [Bacillus sp. VT 712]|jgi:hypothetical protein|uniref:hypothetical protein n=1 Tax=Bacillaceae TaxID=186817 RepID=UPI0004741AE4|nr:MULTISPECIES: hypothetical protein [Bacillaceae]KZB91752.1 hypothetical protein A2U94_09730 [Bacillus sp. VT 712]
MKQRYLYVYDDSTEVIKRDVVRLGDELYLAKGYEGLSVHKVLRRTEDGTVKDWKTVIETHLFGPELLDGIDLSSIAKMSVADFFAELAHKKRTNGGNR